MSDDNAEDVEGVDESAELFPDRANVRAACLKALGDVSPVADPEGYEYFGARTNAGRKLPPAYLVHFLLVDLLKFPSTGIGEKVAWTIPVVHSGKTFTISHRKFGVGVFGGNALADEDAALEITNRIQKAVKEARPFFDWLARRAVERSKLNVVNNANDLFDRFEYLLKLYKEKRDEAVKRKDERSVTEIKDEKGNVTGWSHSFPVFQLEDEARWLALSVIEAFFSWTEHVFIHIGILNCRVITGIQVTELAAADWETKFKTALDLKDPETSSLYNQLIELRRELRNFVAHGAFGKQGEAFSFHSTAGAVPVLLPHKAGSRKFRLSGETDFNDDEAVALIGKFVGHLWSGRRSSARMYIQESYLPLILTLAMDGTYDQAMQSEDAMRKLIDRMNYQADTAANMDW